VKHAVVSSSSGWSSPKGSCENDTGLPGSLKGTEFLGKSRNTVPLGRQSARDSQLLQKQCPTG